MHGVKGVTELSRLPYFDTITDVPVDPMHCIAGFIEKILKLMKKNTPQDGVPTRTFEEQVGRFPETWVSF